MTEIWKDIQGYEGLYQVSNLGRVKSLTRILEDGRIWKEKIIKPRKNTNGYLQVILYKDGRNYKLIHRLVTEAFIPNPKNLPQVNHKDEDKTNNYVGTPEKNYTDGNLEWCNAEYNINYSKSKTVLQLRKDGSLVRIWPSTMEVKRQLHYHQSNISACCSGKVHTANGYKWCYAEK